MRVNQFFNITDGIPFTKEQLKEKLAEVKNMRCPNCGNPYFDLTVSTETVITNTSIGDSFPILRGRVDNVISTIQKCKCTSCGEELMLEALKPTVYCAYCGDRINGKIAYKYRDMLYHHYCIKEGEPVVL